MAQNEMKAKPALPERVRSMEGLGINLANAKTLIAERLELTLVCMLDHLVFFSREGEFHLRAL